MIWFSYSGDIYDKIFLDAEMVEFCIMEEDFLTILATFGWFNINFDAEDDIYLFS